MAGSGQELAHCMVSARLIPWPRAYFVLPAAARQLTNCPHCKLAAAPPVNVLSTSMDRTLMRRAAGCREEQLHAGDAVGCNGAAATLCGEPFVPDARVGGLHVRPFRGT